MRRQRWIGIGVGLALVAGLGIWWWAGPEPDSWPARLVIDPGPDNVWGYTPDGRWYRTVNGSNLLTAWDTTTGARGATSAAPLVYQKRLSSDGRRFVGWLGNYMPGEIVVGDAATEAIEQRFPVSLVQAIHLSFGDHDGTIEAVLQTQQWTLVILTWNLATGAESWRTITGPGPGYVQPVAYSPDGRTWAYLNLKQNALQLWDNRTDRPIGGPLRTPTTVRDLNRWQWATAQFTPDGRTLIAGRSDGQLEFWNVADGHLVQLVQVHPVGSTPTQLAITSDGRTLVSKATNLTLPSSFRMVGNWVYQMVTTKQAAGNPTESAVVDLATRRVLGRVRQSSFVGFSPDGREAITRDQYGPLSIRPIARVTQP